MKYPVGMRNKSTEVGEDIDQKITCCKSNPKTLPRPFPERGDLQQDSARCDSLFFIFHHFLNLPVFGRKSNGLS